MPRTFLREQYSLSMQRTKIRFIFLLSAKTEEKFIQLDYMKLNSFQDLFKTSFTNNKHIERSKKPESVATVNRVLFVNRFSSKLNRILRQENKN